MSEYEESLSFIIGSPDDLFPDWLFSPAFNDFEDNYYERSFAESKAELAAKKIRRKYNDPYQWVEAMETYNEYMQEMIEKWGSLSIIENSVEADTMPDFIPAEPRLKNSKKNKEFMRTGILPPKHVLELPISDQDIIEVASQLFPDADPENMKIEENYKPSKEEIAAYKRMVRTSERKERRHNMYRRIGASHGTDFIVEYLNNAKSGVYNGKGKRDDSYEDRSLASIAKELQHIEETPQYILDEENATATDLVAGRIVKRAQQEQVEICKIMYEQGFNVIGPMSAHMDKKAVKMIRSQIGATEPMTKKEMRKLKKRNKKDQRRIQKRRDQSEYLSQMLLGNKIKGIERDEDGVRTFRLRDVFPD